MHPRFALSLHLCLAIVASAAVAASEPVAVRDLALEVDAESERLLIFTGSPVEPRLIPIDARTLMISLPGTALAPSAPSQLAPITQGTIVRATVFDRAEPLVTPEVRVVVHRRPGDAPRIERSGNLIALVFDTLRRPAPPADDQLSLSYRRAPMRRVVEELARATGQTFVFDDAVSGLGSITIEGPGRVSRREAAALLDTLLLFKGFAAVPGPGGIRTVVAISGAPSPWVPGGELDGGDAPVTTMFRLETALATELIPLLQPYIGAQVSAVAFEPTNSLILAGPASRILRLRTAVEALDEIEAGTPVFWQLDYADAQLAAEQVLLVLGERDVPTATGDPRTNTLLLRVRPEALDRARALVDRLDRPDRGVGALHVIRLRYADPETLAAQLERLRDDAPGDPSRDPAALRGGLRGLDFHIVAEPATRSLVVRSSPEAWGPLIDTVRTLDVMPSAVRVEVTISRITLDDRLELGTTSFIPTLTNPKAPNDLIAAVTVNPLGGDPTVAPAGLPFTAAFTRSPLLLPILNPFTGEPLLIPRENFAVTLDGREVRSEVLLRPQILVTSGDEHEIFAGDNIPVPVSSTASTGDGTVADPVGQIRQDIERYDVGTSLRLTPTVGHEGGVTLDLSVEVSTLEESQAGPVERVGPSIREIQIETRMRLRHGEIAVIAGESQPIVARRVIGVPWLKDIPVLGWAFRATRDVSMKRYLLVAAQAEILRPEFRERARALAELLGPPGAEAIGDEASAESGVAP